MAVTDPTYENFNYQGLLDRAASPLQTLGQGQLAIAQQENARRFEALQEQRRSESQQRNRLAEISATEAAGERGEAARMALTQKAALEQKEAAAKQINPDFTPDTSSSINERIAKADRVSYNKTVSNLKASADNVNMLWGQARGLVDAQGRAKPVDPVRVNNAIIQDPALVKVLDSRDIQKLKDGMTPEQLASTFTFNSNKQLLLASAQDARNKLAQETAQMNASALGLTLQELNSRASAAAETHGRVAQSLPPDLQSEILAYTTKMGYQLPSSANPNGLVPSLSNPAGAAAKTPQSQLPPDVNEQGLAALPDQMQNPEFKSVVAQMIPDYLHYDPSHLIPDAITKAQDGLDAAKTQLRLLGATPGASGKTIIDPTYTDYGASGIGSSMPGLMAHGAKRFLSPVDITKRQKMADEANQHAISFSNALNLLKNKLPQQPLPGLGSPTPIQPIPPPPASSIPLPNTPGGFQYNTNSVNGQPSASNQPSGQQDPMQLRSSLNQIGQRLGTSDPNVLQQAIQKVQQMGIDVKALGQGIGNNDPNAIATAKSIIQQIQGGGQNPVSAGQLPPDMASFGI